MYLDCIIAEPVGQDANERVPDSSIFTMQNFSTRTFGSVPTLMRTFRSLTIRDCRASPGILRPKSPNVQRFVLSARRSHSAANFINYISQFAPEQPCIEFPPPPPPFPRLQIERFELSKLAENFQPGQFRFVLEEN